jgi:hypothetical protein
LEDSTRERGIPWVLEVHYEMGQRQPATEQGQIGYEIGVSVSGERTTDMDRLVRRWLALVSLARAFQMEFCALLFSLLFLSKSLFDSFWAGFG